MLRNHQWLNVLNGTRNSRRKRRRPFTLEALEPRLVLSATAITSGDAPASNDANFTLDEDTTVSGFLEGSDPEGAALTYAVVDTTNLNGDVTIDSETGAFEYTPDFDFNGSASFTFTTSDGQLTSNEATVTLEILSVEDVPVITDVSFLLLEDRIFGFAFLPAFDGDGDELTFRFEDISEINGTIEFLDEPQVPTMLFIPARQESAVGVAARFSFIPDPDFNGIAFLTYSVSDGNQRSEIARISFNLAPVFDAPEALDATTEVSEDTSIVVTLPTRNPDGFALTYSLLDTSQANGSVELLDEATGEYRYTPSADFNGEASFTFSLTDGENTSQATVTLDVIPVNDAPTVNAAAFSLPENSATGTVVGTVVGQDIDNDQLTYTIVSGNTDDGFAIDETTGVITVNNVDAIDFETNPAFNLQVQVTDSEGQAATSDVDVSLSNVIERRRSKFVFFSTQSSGSSVTTSRIRITTFGSVNFFGQSSSTLRTRIVTSGSAGSSTQTSSVRTVTRFRSGDGNSAVTTSSSSTSSTSTSTSSTSATSIASATSTTFSERITRHRERLAARFSSFRSRIR